MKVKVYENNDNHEGKVVKMIKNVRKTKVNRRGVVLVTAVGVLLLVFILLTAVVGYVSVNRTQTNENYKKEQAYLTASSTVQSFVAQIKQDTAAPSDPTDAIATAKQKKAIQDLQNLAAANGGKGTTINVTYNGTDGSGITIQLLTQIIRSISGLRTCLRQIFYLPTADGSVLGSSDRDHYKRIR